MITVDVTPKNIDLSAITDAIDSVGEIELLKAALMASTMIKERTIEHVDYKGHMFVEYSPAYLVTREEKGLPTIPDLFFKGNMLAAMAVDQPSKTQSRLFFRAEAEAEKAYRHMAGDGVPAREFFDLSMEETDRIMAYLVKQFYQKAKESWQ